MKKLFSSLVLLTCSILFSLLISTTAFGQCLCNSTVYYCVNSTIGNDHASFYSSTYQFPSSNVYISGIFYVDHDFDIHGVNITFAYDGAIVINSTETLTIDQSSYLTLDGTCSDLWRGIYNSGDLILTSSTIELAQDALTCYNNSDYTITDATFNRNYEGILFSGISGTYPGTVVGTSFQCLSGTTPVALGYAPYATVRSHVGIDVTGVSLVNVGDNTSLDANTFDNLDYGIYSNSTGGGLNAELNNFYRCNVATFSGVTHPAAIHMENSSGSALTLSVTSSTIGSSATTNGIHRGIDINGDFNVTIEGGHLTYIEKYGILMTNNNVTTTTIDHLTIDNFGTAAIYMHDNPGTSNSVKSEQDISYLAVSNGGSGAGIIDIESAYPNYVELHIHDMPSGSGYFLDDLNTGVRLERLKQYTSTAIIHDCWITDVTNIGIQITNCVAPKIASNTITSANGTSTGIYSDNTMGSYIGVNDISDHEKGFYGTGDLTSTNMVCNTFTNCDYGVYFHDVSNFGDVGSSGNPSDNQWYTVGTDGIYADYPPTTDAAQFKWYTINPNQTVCPHTPALNTVLHPSSGSQGPSTPVNLSSWYTCGSSTCGLYMKLDSVGELLQDRTILLDNIVLNTGIYTTLSSFQQYMENVFAYGILSSDTSYLHLGTDQDARYQQFYDSLQQTNIGAFHQLAIVAQSGDTASADALNSSIAPANDRETYLQELFEIYNRTIAVDTSAFTAQDSSLLLDIAYMDPNIAGDAPFMAQAMLGIVVIRDVERMEYHYDGQSMESAEVFPNPAEDFTQVQINNFQAEKYFLKIYDLTGALILSYTLTSPYTKVNLNELNAGSYLFNLCTVNKIISRGKLIKL